MLRAIERWRNQGTALATGVLLLATTLCLGCFGGCRREPATGSTESFSGAALQGKGPKTPTDATGSTNKGSAKEATATVSIEQRDQLNAFLQEGKKEEAVNALLARAQSAMQGRNYDAALRDLERLKLQHPDDPYVAMRVQYLEARIAHRQNNAKARKTAMDAMLKSMERVQQDPRFQEAHREGRVAQDVIKQSIQQGGEKYANP